MTKKEKWKILLDGLNLKVGDEIVITSYQRYFSNSKAKGRYVRYKYVPTYYKIAEEERNYYLVERYKGKYQDSGSMYGDFSHPIYNILDDFELPKDAKFKEDTTILYPTRADYYRACPEQNIWKYDNPDYPGDEDKLQTYYEVVENMNYISSSTETKLPEDEVKIRMKDKEAFIKRVNDLHLSDKYFVRTVQTVMDLKEK